MQQIGMKFLLFVFLCLQGSKVLAFRSLRQSSHRGPMSTQLTSKSMLSRTCVGLGPFTRRTTCDERRSVPSLGAFAGRKDTYYGSGKDGRPLATSNLSSNGFAIGIVLRTLMIFFASIIFKYGMKACIKQWTRVGAGTKFNRAGGCFGVYATIPLIAGIVNMITNKVSVWMIFNPINYAGLEILERPEGSPFGFLGWQGIVPSRVKSMGPDIAKTLISLVNLRRVFNRLDSSRLASMISPKLEIVVDSFVKRKLADPETNPMLISLGKDSHIYSGFGNFYQKTLSVRLKGAVENIIRTVQMDPEKYLDLEGSIVDTLVQDKRIICKIFQTCGKSELDFIVKFGLFGGFALGVLQMLTWLMWSPPWSLALGGAIVGYLTDACALAVMFKPVDPIRIGNLLSIQGMFLRRQKEVSKDFAKLACEQLLTSGQLWNFLCDGPRREALTDLIEFHLRRELEWLLPAVPNTDWRALASKVQGVLPSAAESTHAYMTDNMQLREDVCSAMAAMPSRAFEKVLHPIFEEDEKTLIAVGTVLGAAAGAAQAAMY